MEKFYSEWKETIFNFTFDSSSHYKVRLTEPFCHHYFKKKKVSSLLVVQLKLNSKGVLFTFSKCPTNINILIKPTCWKEYWDTIEFKHLSPLMITFNDDCDVLFDEMALITLNKFKSWLIQVEQAEPLQKNILKNVAIAEPHLINGNVEFTTRLCNNQGGKQAYYSYHQYQLYCWAKYYYFIDSRSYNTACEKTIKLHSSAPSKNGVSEQESLRKDITKKYDDLKGLNQLDGCCIPPNNFF
jgi:hypothetical protein